MTAAHSAPGQGPKLSVVETAPAGNSPGQRLARARTQQNMTVEAVARHLNMAVSMVRALEADNHKNLPGKAFVKGYLRNYAKLVGQPVEEIVKLYDQQFGVEDEPFVGVAATSRHPARWIAPLVKVSGMLLILAILLSLLVLLVQNAGFLFEKGRELVSTVVEDQPAEIQSATAVEQEDAPAGAGNASLNLPLPMQPMEQNSNNAPAIAVPPVTPPAATPATAPEAAVPPAGAAPVNDPAPSPAAQPRADAAVVDPANAVTTRQALPQAPVQNADSTAADNIPTDSSDAVQGGATLGLAFSGASWVRILDAEQRVLFDGIKQAGTELQLEGKTPLSVRLGYAPGVRVTFNGQPYAFAISGNSNVTQFTLGAN